jgi:P27 family predicted phage terminase small subunit
MSANKGRPRKPTALKVLHGDFDKNPKRRNKSEPTPDLAIPKCPAWLSEHAKAEWKRITKEVGDLKVLSLGERGALEQYCDTYGKWRECNETIKADGQWYSTNHGLAEHPAAKAHRVYAGMCQKLLCEFGLTPSSRSRLAITKEPEVDETEKRFFG